MKKLVAIIATVAMLGGLLIFGEVVFANFDGTGIYVSRINADDDDEWIEIRNTNTNDIDITSLELLNYNGNGNLNPTIPISLKNGVFKADSYILIRRSQEKTGNFDQGYSSAIIPKSGGGMKLFINGIKVNDFCWGSWEGNGQVCKVVGLTFVGKFSSLSDKGSISINECELAETNEGCLINNFPIITYTEVYQPSFGGFIPNEVDIDPDDDDDLDPSIEQPEPQYCKYLKLSEISTNDQWIEIYNESSLTIRSENLEDCYLSVQYGDKITNGRPNYRTLSLGGYIGDGVISPYTYPLVSIGSTNLSLAKNVKDRSVLIHNDESDFDETKYSTQKTSTALAYFSDGWKATYAITPGEENIYQQYQTCEAGKHINEATGNCVKDPDPPAECAEGQYRNPETGRCKKYAEANVLAECAEGQFRNPETNRCKKIATEDDLVPCAEGYERNPETNRCRKIQSSGDAEYAVEPYGVSNENRTWATIGAASVAGLGLIIGFQFRNEIASGFRKILRRKR